MRTANEIRTEPDPILREIYAAGWNQVLIDQCTQEIILVSDDVEKRISKYEIATLQLSYCGGTRHRWVREGDGSCERLRQLIKL